MMGKTRRGEMSVRSCIRLVITGHTKSGRGTWRDFGIRGNEQTCNLGEGLFAFDGLSTPFEVCLLLGSDLGYTSVNHSFLSMCRGAYRRNICPAPRYSPFSNTDVFPELSNLTVRPSNFGES